jgi:hypothetical protein
MYKNKLGCDLNPLTGLSNWTVPTLTLYHSMYKELRESDSYSALPSFHQSTICENAAEHVKGRTTLVLLDLQGIFKIYVPQHTGAT